MQSLVKIVYNQIQPTSYAEKEPSKRNPTSFTSLSKILDDVKWRNGRNDLWIPMYDIVQTNGKNWNQPDDYNWCKHDSHFVSAKVLQSKQAHQYNTSKYQQFTYKNR